MVKTVNDRDEPALGWDQEPEVEPQDPLPDNTLLDLLDALVEERGRAPAPGGDVLPGRVHDHGNGGAILLNTGAASRRSLIVNVQEH